MARVEFVERADGWHWIVRNGSGNWITSGPFKSEAGARYSLARHISSVRTGTIQAALALAEVRREV